MKTFGLVMIVAGVLTCLCAIAAPTRKLEGLTWKARWVQQKFGKRGLRLYLLTLGVLFVWFGFLANKGNFP